MSALGTFGAFIGGAIGSAIAPGVGTTIGANLGKQGFEGGFDNAKNSNYFGNKIDAMLNPGKASAMKNYEAIINSALEFSKNKNVPEKIALTLYACNFSSWLEENKSKIGDVLGQMKFEPIPSEFASYLNVDGVKYAKTRFLIPADYSVTGANVVQTITDNKGLLISLVFILVVLFFGKKIFQRL